MQRNKQIYALVVAVFFSATATATPITSTGDNPVWAVGGTQTTGNQTISVITASSSQDILVTDIIFSITGFGTSATSCIASITLQDSNGNVLGSYRVASRDNVNYGGGITPTSISHSYRAGLPIYTGTSLEMLTDISCGSLGYSVSGLHVRP
jgi:hypothetical protein